MLISYSSKFTREYKKFSEELRSVAKEKEKIFRQNPFDSRLETHKLHGKYLDCWAFTVVGPYRIMFKFIGKGRIDFINIGDHDIYK